MSTALPHGHRYVATVTSPDLLDATAAACRALIGTRFPGTDSRGAAAVLLDDGTILTGTSPDFLNSSTTLCHEAEPSCAAYRLDRRVLPEEVPAWA